MDFDELLRLKTEAILELRREVPLDDFDRQLNEELAKGSSANWGVIENCLNVISSIMYPGRGKQIESQFAEGLAGRRVLCVVDFAAIPYSFNVLVYLMVCNKFRVETAADVMDVAFVGHASTPGILNQSHHTEEVIKNRFRTLCHNLGIAATRLVPNVGSVMFFDNRALFATFLDSVRSSHAIFPPYYDPRFPLVRTSESRADNFCFIHLTDAPRAEDVLVLKRPHDETLMARRWLKKNVYPAIPVTLTLRNLSFEPVKNSDPEKWTRILTEVRDPRVKFVILPDYYDAFGDEKIVSENVVYCPEATLSLPLRAATYGAAAFNIFGNNGPLAIGYLSTDIHYLIFLDTVATGSSSASEIKRGEGLEPGGQFWGASDFQRLVWETQDEGRMAEAIAKLIADLDRTQRLVPEWYAGVD